MSPSQSQNIPGGPPEEEKEVPLGESPGASQEHKRNLHWQGVKDWLKNKRSIQYKIVKEEEGETIRIPLPDKDGDTQRALCVTRDLATDKSNKVTIYIISQRMPSPEMRHLVDFKQIAITQELEKEGISTQSKSDEKQFTPPAADAIPTKKRQWWDFRTWW